MKKVIRLFSVLLILALLGVTSTATTHPIDHNDPIYDEENTCCGIADNYMDGDDYTVTFNVTTTPLLGYNATSEAFAWFSTYENGMTMSWEIIDFETAATNSASAVISDKDYEGNSAKGTFADISISGRVYIQYRFTHESEEIVTSGVGDYGFAVYSGSFYFGPSGQFCID